MYFTIPSIYIPECLEHENNVEIMSVYQNIYNKLKNSEHKEIKTIEIPRAKQNSEEFITCSIRLLGEAINKTKVKYYADCRSSSSASVPASSYKILALNKLPTTIPFCVQHLGGNEFFNGLLLLKSLVNLDSQCLITTNQRLQYVTERFRETDNYLGDASSAILCTQRVDFYYKQYELLEVGNLPFKKFDSNVYVNLKNYLSKQDMDISNVKWLIINNISSKINDMLEIFFPQIKILQRNTYNNFNFGSTDIPISMNILYDMIEINSLGILLSQNLFDNIDFAIIKKV